MVVNASQNGQEPTPAHPLDRLVVDPTGRPPMCDEEMFVSILDEMVADEAPRMFAIVQEYGERVDARIAGWGMSFDDRAVAFDTEGTIMKLQAAENALRGFGFGSHIRPRLVWVDPSLATLPAPEDE
jgi:hypothetical protein